MGPLGQGVAGCRPHSNLPIPPPPPTPIVQVSYGVNRNGRCVRCQVPGCSSCGPNAARCESCAWGWRRNGKTGTCQRCPPGCGSCATSPRKCDDCLDDKRWKLVGGRCIKKRYA